MLQPLRQSKFHIFLLFRQILHMFRLIDSVDNAALPSNEENGSKNKSIAEKKVKVLAAPWSSLDSYSCTNNIFKARFTYISSIPSVFSHLKIL